jgi:uncharacterized membrane protein required for colicin V production
MNWMDLLLIFLVAWNVFRGYERGLVLTVFSLASYLAGWWAASKYGDLLTENLIKSDAFYPPMYEWIYGFLARRSDRAQISYLVEESVQDSWLTLPLPEVAKNWLQNPEAAVQLIQGAEERLLSQAAATLTLLVVSFISFVVVFLVVKQVVYLLGLILNGIFKLPVLNALNRFGGFGAGLLRSVLVIWLLLILTTPFTAAAPQGLIAEGLRNSAILTWFLGIR